MYSPKALIRMTFDIEYHKDRLIMVAEKYATQSVKQVGKVITKHFGIFFEFDTGLYKEYTITNLKTETNEEVEMTYNVLCHQKYNFGYPTVLAVTVLQMKIEKFEILNDVQRMVREPETEVIPSVVIYVQTELISKFTIYRVVKDGIQPDKELSQTYAPSPGLFNLGYTISIVPGLS